MTTPADMTCGGKSHSRVLLPKGVSLIFSEKLFVSHVTANDESRGMCHDAEFTSFVFLILELDCVLRFGHVKYARYEVLTAVLLTSRYVTL